MKIRNTKTYRDKETNEVQEIGAIREVTKKRGAVIIKAGYAEEYTEAMAAADAEAMAAADAEAAKAQNTSDE